MLHTFFVQKAFCRHLKVQPSFCFWLSSFLIDRLSSWVLHIPFNFIFQLPSPRWWICSGDEVWLSDFNEVLFLLQTCNCCCWLHWILDSDWLISWHVLEYWVLIGQWWVVTDNVYLISTRPSTFDTLIMSTRLNFKIQPSQHSPAQKHLKSCKFFVRILKTNSELREV